MEKLILTCHPLLINSYMAFIPMLNVVLGVNIKISTLLAHPAVQRMGW